MSCTAPMITFSETIETLLKPYAELLGQDFNGYRNHLYRIVNFCHLLKPLSKTESDKIEIAAVFHDLAIWTDKTADYVPPSEGLARTYLESIDFPEWRDEICQMIHDHHKITRSQPKPTERKTSNTSELPSEEDSLTEIFRQADWIDVTLGLRSFGLKRDQINSVIKQFPDEGFHPLLARVVRSQLFKHPFNPLPMLKW